MRAIALPCPALQCGALLHRYVMDDVTEDSLVLVDELGKGTEVRAGAAIAGAMLERLDAIRCRGIFATSVTAPKPRAIQTCIA